MKKILLSLVLLLMVSSPCFGYDLWKGELDPMTKEDWQKQTALIVLQVIDWGQTRTIAIEKIGWYYDESRQWWYHSDNYKHYETNVFLGEHPSIAEVNDYFTKYILLHATITYILPKKIRPYWQYVFIVEQVRCVGTNISAGIKMKF
jgi:hypothetical protein